MWSVWCRALMVALLVALGASLELYDQMPANEDLFYQDDNDIDTGPVKVLPRVSDVMMRKLISAWQLQQMSDFKPANRPHLSSLKEIEGHIERGPGTNPFKEPVFKRLAEVFGGPASAHRTWDSGRPQQKWKIKKGKSLGSQMVCYFKLCAFRSPA